MDAENTVEKREFDRVGEEGKKQETVEKWSFLAENLKGLWKERVTGR
jgi:hypothetical protein